MADAEAAQYQPSAEELLAAIKEIKEKNPDFGIKRVYTELKVRLRRLFARPFACGLRGMQSRHTASTRAGVLKLRGNGPHL